MPLQLGSGEENGQGFLCGPLMLKAKSTENLSNFDLLTFDLLGALEIRGVKRSDFIAKGTSLREYTSIEPFCAKVRWEYDPQSRD